MASVPEAADIREKGLASRRAADARFDLAKSGAAAAVISKALGHVSPQSAKAYVHLDVEPARLAIEKALGGLGDAP
jgi:hypothetical protein